MLVTSGRYKLPIKGLWILFNIESFFGGLFAFLAAMAGAGVAIYLNRRQSSQAHARERNPEYFKDIYIKTVRLRDAIADFDVVWDRNKVPFSQFIIGLFKIVMARTEDYNRALSPSTNENVFLLPTRLEERCALVRERINTIIFESRIAEGAQIIRTRVDGADLMNSERRINSFPVNKKELTDIRFVEVRKRPELKESDLFSASERVYLVSELNVIAREIKKLCVD